MQYNEVHYKEILAIHITGEVPWTCLKVKIIIYLLLGD
jgi:hypothetical protein